MRPIPRSLLIHSAVLYEEQENSWQEKELIGLAKLSHIRVEPASKMIITADNRSVTLSATLFYDCRNSVPGVEFKPGYIVEFDGKGTALRLSNCSTTGRSYIIWRWECACKHQHQLRTDSSRYPRGFRKGSRYNLSAGSCRLQRVRSGRSGCARQQLEYPQRCSALKARLGYALCAVSVSRRADGRPENRLGMGAGRSDKGTDLARKGAHVRQTEAHERGLPLVRARPGRPWQRVAREV